MSTEDINEETTYDVIDFTDEQGVEHCMVFIDTHTIDGVQYSILMEEDEFLSESEGPQTLHVVKHIFDENQEEFLVGLEEEEMARVMEELENHLMTQPE